MARQLQALLGIVSLQSLVFIKGGLRKDNQWTRHTLIGAQDSLMCVWGEKADCVVCPFRLTAAAQICAEKLHRSNLSNMKKSRCGPGFQLPQIWIQTEHLSASPLGRSEGGTENIWLPDTAAPPQRPAGLQRWAGTSTVSDGWIQACGLWACWVIFNVIRTSTFLYVFLYLSLVRCEGGFKRWSLCQSWLKPKLGRGIATEDGVRRVLMFDFTLFSSIETSNESFRPSCSRTDTLYVCLIKVCLQGHQIKPHRKTTAWLSLLHI